jgi:hypothetical protein
MRDGELLVGGEFSVLVVPEPSTGLEAEIIRGIAYQVPECSGGVARFSIAAFRAPRARKAVDRGRPLIAR